MRLERRRFIGYDNVLENCQIVPDAVASALSVPVEICYRKTYAEWLLSFNVSRKFVNKKGNFLSGGQEIRDDEKHLAEIAACP